MADKKDDKKDDQTKGAETEREEAQNNQEGEEGENGESGKKKGPNKLLLIIIAAGVILGGGAAGAFFLLFSGDDEVEQAVKEEAVDPMAAVADIAFYELPKISVNLASPYRVSRYLKLTISLELSSAGDIPVIEKLLPRIQDDFQFYLRSLKVEDIQGSAGLQQLKEELLLRVNQSAAPVRVRNVLFKELLIQ